MAQTEILLANANGLILVQPHVSAGVSVGDGWLSLCWLYVTMTHDMPVHTWDNQIRPNEHSSSHTTRILTLDDGQYRMKHVW
jgi:hypothetical protein